MGEDCTHPIREDDLLHIARGHAINRVTRLGVECCPHLVDDLAQEFCLKALQSLQSEKVRDGRISAVRHYQLRAGTFGVNAFIDWWLRRHNREHLTIDKPLDSTDTETVADVLPSCDEDLAEATALTLDTRLAWQIADTVLGGVRLEVIRLRYGMGLDKRKTGKRLGISEKVVARYERDAINELREAVKRSRANGNGTVDDPILSISPPGDWTAEDVWKAVDRLPPASRDALRMRFSEGLTRAEIAERQGLSSANSSGRETRAIRKLRRVLESVRLGAPLEEVTRGLRRGNSQDAFRNPLEAELERSRVLAEIPRLPEELRRVMELHVVEGLGKCATARRLGTWRQTVRKQINRAWDQLRERIYAASAFIDPRGAFGCNEGRVMVLRIAG